MAVIFYGGGGGAALVSTKSASLQQPAGLSSD